MRSILLMALAGGAVAMPARAAEQNEESARQVIERGERLFQRTCTRCHNAMEADERTNRQWEMMVPQMREIANITREEARAIIAYLVAENEEEQAERSERDPSPDRTRLRTAPADATASSLGPAPRRPATVPVIAQREKQRAADLPNGGARRRNQR